MEGPKSETRLLFQVECSFPGKKRQPDEKEHLEGEINRWAGGEGGFQGNAGVTKVQPRPWHIWKDGKGRKREGKARGRRLVVPLGLPSPAKPLLQKLNTLIPSRSSSVGSARRALSPLAAGRRPAPPRRHAWSREGAGSVLPPSRPTRPRRDSHAQCCCEGASPLPVGVGAYQKDFQCRGKGKERTPREVSKRERGIGGNARGILK